MSVIVTLIDVAVGAAATAIERSGIPGAEVVANQVRTTMLGVDAAAAAAEGASKGLSNEEVATVVSASVVGGAIAIGAGFAAAPLIAAAAPAIAAAAGISALGVGLLMDAAVAYASNELGKAAGEPAPPGVAAAEVSAGILGLATGAELGAAAGPAGALLGGVLGGLLGAAFGKDLGQLAAYFGGKLFSAHYEPLLLRLDSNAPLTSSLFGGAHFDYDANGFPRRLDGPPSARVFSFMTRTEVTSRTVVSCSARP